MTRRRFIADEVEGDRAALLGEHAAHLSKVLRAQVGQQFDIAANGSVRRGEITKISNQRVDFLLHEAIDAAAHSQREVTLLLSIFKFDRMEWAIEKAVELGVANIIPVIARRTEAHFASAAAKRVERWKRIAREASQQSRRSLEPDVAESVKLQTAVEASEGCRIVLSEHESPERVSLKQLVNDHHDDPLTIAIGPEGGWTAEELGLFQQNGWHFTSLGPTILRAETAAIAALAIAIS
jgi:16S rRNA (uracil1498-N3)-methyltransferase